MDTEKRLLWAAVLSMAFLYVWGYLNPPAKKPELNKTASVEQSNNGAQGATTKQSPISAGTTAAAATPVAPEQSLEVSDLPVETGVLQNELVSATWSTRGGNLQTVTLYKYNDKTGEGAKPVKVAPFDSQQAMAWNLNVAGQSLNDANITFELTHKSDNKVVFVHDSPKVRWEKHIVLKVNSYEFSQTLRVQNKTAAPANVEAKFSMIASKRQPPEAGFLAMFSGPPEIFRGMAFVGDKTERFDLPAFEEGKNRFESPIEWVGYETQYFVGALATEKGRWQEGRAQLDAAGNMQMAMVYPAWTLNPNSSQDISTRMYVGPKDIGLLKNFGVSLDRSIDLGSWLGVIARPMLHFLRWIHSFIPNYGIAIILLTVLVRLMMFPLTQMQAKSMRKMQTHKPQMDALKERYKDDREGHSRALMEYMRKEKINPMGGCLMLLPQIPLFFALYRVLYNSIELRHAPFLAWIQDLSAHDPIFILPLCLGVAMFFQQKFMPTPSAEPAQQAMMKMMPIMFTVFMLFLPAGLNLYILVSTLWGIGQQSWVHKGGAASVLPEKVS